MLFITSPEPINSIRVYDILGKDYFKKIKTQNK